MAKRPRIVIIGAGMAGLTAANKLYTSTNSKHMFDLCVVEGGSRIGGRINTSEFCGDRIEMGATWIHGIEGSPVHKIAQEINALDSKQPWECMDTSDGPKTFTEDGYELESSVFYSVSNLFKNLMEFSQGKLVQTQSNGGGIDFYEIADKALKIGFLGDVKKKISVGLFLKLGFEVYWDFIKTQKENKGFYKNWNSKLIEEGVFSVFENIQRTYTSAGDLLNLDFKAESEYVMFPGEEITIAKGYSSVIQSLASVLPDGLIKLNRKVIRIEWQQEDIKPKISEKGLDFKPVKLIFSDGSVILADHVIVTVSLGVLKSGITEDSPMFNPPLPEFKIDAIRRLGYGVVNKLFVEMSSAKSGTKKPKLPSIHMVFHNDESEHRVRKIPWWMRKTSALCPIYKNSSVLLSWFAGKEALELESLDDKEIIDGLSSTVSSFLRESSHELKIGKVLKSKWGSDPLFLGSYSYVSTESSCDDLDVLAEPIPDYRNPNHTYQLQILFAGEATHRTHYSTTHGAYFSGLREANRLLRYFG